MSLYHLIKDKVDIVDLISEDVELKPLNNNEFIGSCPFHEDNHPSFTVNNEKGVYHCFSCHESGNIITYYEKTKQLSYEEALIQLAQKYNIDYDKELEHYNINNYNQYKKYVELMNDVQEYFVEKLKKDSEAKNYLTKTRKMDYNEIDFWQLGLDDGLLYQYLLNKGYRINELLESKIVKTDEKGQIRDTFMNRITYPLKDKKGNILGFSARIYKKNDNRKAKYLNTTNNEFFRKNDILFNYGNTYKNLLKNPLKGIFLFEGQQDVISSYNSGIDTAIASLGTSLTSNQIKEILKMTDKITICYDGDNAGLDAIKKGIHSFKEINKDCSIYVVLFPEGQDADDLFKNNNKKYLKEYIDKNSELSIVFLIKDYYEEYLFKLSKNDFSDLDIQEKTKLYKEILNLIDFNCNILEKRYYLNKLDKIFEFDDEDNINNKLEEIEENISNFDSLKNIYIDEEQKEISNLDIEKYEIVKNIEEKIITYLLKNDLNKQNKKMFKKIIPFLNETNGKILLSKINDNDSILNNYEKVLKKEYEEKEFNPLFSEEGLVETISNNNEIKKRKNIENKFETMADNAINNNDRDTYFKALQQIINLKK